MNRGSRYSKIFSSDKNNTNTDGGSQSRGFVDGSYRQIPPEKKGRTRSSRSGKQSSSARSDSSVKAASKKPQVKTAAAKTSRSNMTYRKKRTKKKGGCFHFLFMIIFLLILLFIGAYLLIGGVMKKVSSVNLDKNSIVTTNNDSNMKKYQTIVLYGVDNQDNEIYDKGSRTDSIIVASINMVTKEVRLMSIYRDTYVSINGEYDKINAAYAYGGPELAISTINRNLDLDITDFATVNFKALADAVDIVGGVELEIKSEKELKNLNDYIGNMNKINGGDSPKFDSIGTYTFDGNQAVAYSRIRYMEGGDHERANHQRLVITGLVNQIKKKPWKLKELIDTVVPQCKTSFTSSELTSLALALPLYKIVDSQAYPFDSFDEKYNGIYYGFPTTVYSNVQQAHEYLFGTKDYTPTEECCKISDKVKNIADSIY